MGDKSLEDCMRFMATPPTCEGVNCGFRHNEKTRDMARAKQKPTDCYFWLQDQDECSNRMCEMQHPPLDPLSTNFPVPKASKEENEKTKAAQGDGPSS